MNINPSRMSIYEEKQDTWILGEMLGKGGFAKVYMCTSMDTNRTYAVKIVPKANLKKTRARQKVNNFD